MLNFIHRFVFASGPMEVCLKVICSLIFLLYCCKAEEIGKDFRTYLKENTNILHHFAVSVSFSIDKVIELVQR